MTTFALGVVAMVAAFLAGYAWRVLVAGDRRARVVVMEEREEPPPPGAMA